MDVQIVQGFFRVSWISQLSPLESGGQLHLDASACNPEEPGLLWLNEPVSADAWLETQNLTVNKPEIGNEKSFKQLKPMVSDVFRCCCWAPFIELNHLLQVSALCSFSVQILKRNSWTKGYSRLCEKIVVVKQNSFFNQLLLKKYNYTIDL